ncbi:MAG TPA: hypothetical protein VJ914_01510 [Pseudonocardiaceae bacterium]|nr:hypothetical protein [Pseudonocardiaceae bacterium]
MPARAVFRISLLAAATAATLALGTGVATAAAASVTGTVNTSSGAPVNVHTGPTVGSTVVTTVASGTSVSIDCQINGDSVTGKYGTSTLWDHLPAQGGYVSDTYVYTGSNGQVAPTCGGGGGSTCSISGLGDPNTCAQAVAWAKAHISTSDNPDYYDRCDHVVGLAYGFSASGSTTAYAHWTEIPSQYKHSGDSNVPAGGLAFFSSSGGAGHVMISTGGGQFASTDIHGAGTYTYTTISEIESTWGENYLGWAQPWFQANH